MKFSTSFKMSFRRVRWALGPALFLLALVLGGATPAQAYPQWQFSSGTSRCGQCHFSPSGGGIVTGYARDAVGEELSTWTGDGGFLHGAVELPSRFAIQFDGRVAALGHDAGNPSGIKQAVFPMQADLSLRAGITDQLSFVGVAGYRGQARASDAETGRGAAVPAGGSTFISREHYLMFRPAAMGWYARAGRFFAPYGLRLAEHYAYVRTDTGFGLLEESYNLSGGVVQNEWEFHVTASAPDFVRKMGSRDSGLSGLFEKRIGDGSALGVSARLTLGEGVNKMGGGLFGKSYFEGPKLLLQAEVDVFNAKAAEGGASNQMIAYLAASWFPVKGLWVTPFVERSQTDIATKNTDTNAAGLQLSWFPYPHFELVWMGRGQFAAGQDAAKTGMLFLHYYL